MSVFRALWMSCLPAFLALLAGCATGTSGPAVPGAETAAAAQAGVIENRTADETAAGFAKLYFGAAQQYLKIADYEKAVASFQRALDQKPDYYEAHVGLIEAMVGKGERPAAIQEARNLLESLPEPGTDRQADRARKQAERLLRELDEKAIALSEAAALLAERAAKAEDEGRTDTAIDLYAESLRVWPAGRDAQVRLYRLCKSSGRPFPPSLARTVGRNIFMELGELTPTQVNVKNDKLRYNESKWTLPFFNHGVTFPTGLWAPAPSSIEYELGGKFMRFTATILISSAKGSGSQTEFLEREIGKPGAGTVNFLVVGDGRTLFDSKLVTYASGPKAIQVDVTGVKKLRLEAAEADGRDLLDFAVWADGKLYLAR